MVKLKVADTQTKQGRGSLITLIMDFKTDCHSTLYKNDHQ